MFNPVLLERVFDLRRDDIVILKVLPAGPAQCARAFTAAFVWLSPSQKEYVLATELDRSAEQSGMSIRSLTKRLRKKPPLRGARSPGKGKKSDQTGGRLFGGDGSEIVITRG
jgi:hypothetical protein